MAAINKVTLLGAVVSEPDIRYTKDSHPLWHAIMAVNRPKAQHVEDKDKQADYIHVIVWGDEAERCHAHVRKGSQIAVVGRLQSRNYQKTNEASPEQYNELADLLSTLAIEDEEELLEDILEIAHLDGRKTSHTAYEVSAESVEFLNNCVFEDKDE